jgi:hypothetical protein
MWFVDHLHLLEAVSHSTNSGKLCISLRPLQLSMVVPLLTCAYNPVARVIFSNWAIRVLNQNLNNAGNFFTPRNITLHDLENSLLIVVASMFWTRTALASYPTGLLIWCPSDQHSSAEQGSHTRSVTRSPATRTGGGNTAIYGSTLRCKFIQLVQQIWSSLAPPS